VAAPGVEAQQPKHHAAAFAEAQAAALTASRPRAMPGFGRWPVGPRHPWLASAHADVAYERAVPLLRMACSCTMSISTTLKTWAKRIKRDGVTLWFAGKHPRTPWYAKALGLFVVAYALSPIDLIPDFIPVLGYVDDMILLPVLIWLTVKLLPAEVLAECRVQADAWMETEGRKPSSRMGAVLIVAVWLAVGAALWCWFKPHL